MELLLPFAKSGLAARLREEGAVLREEYVAEGLRISARVDQRLFAQVKDYQIPQWEPEAHQIIYFLTNGVTPCKHLSL